MNIARAALVRIKQAVANLRETEDDGRFSYQEDKLYDALDSYRLAFTDSDEESVADHFGDVGLKLSVCMISMEDAERQEFLQRYDVEQCFIDAFGEVDRKMKQNGELPSLNRDSQLRKMTAHVALKLDDINDFASRMKEGGFFDEKESRKRLIEARNVINVIGNMHDFIYPQMYVIGEPEPKPEVRPYQRRLIG